MYDTEYIRELTAARNANEVARARLKDQDETIVALRAELARARRWSKLWKERAWRSPRERRAHQSTIAAYHALTDMLSEVEAERDALRAEVAALRAQVEAQP